MVVEYVRVSENDLELWEIDYEEGLAINVFELNFPKNRVIDHAGSIEDYLKKKGFDQMHFHDGGGLPKRVHLYAKHSCSFK